jgi:polyketide cyclase/dehydrase/lipid transport protein
MVAAIRSIRAGRSRRSSIFRICRRLPPLLVATACMASLAAAGDAETVRISKTIDVGVEKTWTAIHGICGLNRWFPVIATCRVEGAGVGATRILTLKGDGAELRDTVLENSDGARRLRYQ